MTHTEPPIAFAQVNGAQLAYDLQGQGPPLVFVHAGIADRRMWDPQFEVFSQNFRVLRYDLRGFGQTLVPAGPFSSVGDLLGLLDFVEIDAATLVGCSYGGRIALDVALEHPERVQNLILIGPSVSGEPPSETVLKFWEEEEGLLDRGELDAATELNLRVWVDGPRRTPDEVDARLRQRAFQMQREAFDVPVPDDAEELPPIAPAIERLGEVQAPTLVLVGDLDLPEKVALTERLGRDLPSARHAVIPGGAHLVNLEQPQTLNRLVSDFLAPTLLNSRKAV